jgi:hypothetical protein
LGKGFTTFNQPRIISSQLPKPQETKAKIDKWDSIKQKSFSRAKEPSTLYKDNL